MTVNAVYAAIIRAELGPVFLADAGDATHLNAELRSILGRINTTRTAQYKEQLLRYTCYVHVHAVAPCSLVFLLVTEPAVSRDLCLDALNNLHSAVRSREDLNWSAEGDRPLQAKLQPTLAALLSDLNESAMDGSNSLTQSGGEGSSSGRIDQLRSQVADVKQVMATNVERVLARGERLDDLVDRTEDLEAASAEFRQSAYRVHRQTCWRNAKWNIIAATVAGTLLIGLAVFILYQVGLFN